MPVRSDVCIQQGANQKVLMCFQRVKSEFGTLTYVNSCIEKQQDTGNSETETVYYLNRHLQHNQL